MTPRRYLPLLALAACLAGALAPRPAAAASTFAGWKRFLMPELSSYALAYVPPGIAAAAGPLPVVVLLHGSGARPDDWDFVAPLADELGCVLLLPKSGHASGWGVGPDDTIVARSLDLLRAEVAIDNRRVGLAGHSSGGAYALELAYGTPTGFNGVFALSSPYRTVIRLGDPDRIPPLHFYYGTDDPNFQAGYLTLLTTMLGRLGVPWTADVQTGYGHNNWPDSTLRDGLRFLLDQPVDSCTASATAVCLRQGRFRVEGRFETPDGQQGAAQAVKLTDDSGYLWFFDRRNVEVSFKVLDGCALSGRHWVFAAGMTNVRVELTVTDTATGESRQYTNPQGRAFAPVQDTSALAGCG